MGRLDGDDSDGEGRAEFGVRGFHREIEKAILSLLGSGEIEWHNASDMTVEVGEKKRPIYRMAEKERCAIWGDSAESSPTGLKPGMEDDDVSKSG